MNRPGTTSTTAVEHLFARSRASATDAPASPRRAASAPSRRAAAPDEARFVLVGGFGFARPTRRASATPRARRAPAARYQSEHVVGNEEVFRREAEDLLHLARPRRRRAGCRARPRCPAPSATGTRCASAARRSVGPRSPRRSPVAQPGLERVEVVRRPRRAARRASRTPRSASGRRRCRRARSAVDRDVVVVVDEHHAAELEVAGERRGFVADALHEVAVAADAEHVVVAHARHRSAPAGASRRSRCPTAFGDALTERAGRDLDALRVAVLGVAGRARAPLAELAEVVELEAEAGEVEHRVEQHRRVAGREHEPVAVGPVRRRRVVLHDPRPQHVGERRQRHRRAGVAGVRLLHRVHREAADRR